MNVICDFNSVEDVKIVQVIPDHVSGYYDVIWIDVTGTDTLKVSKVNNSGTVINTFTLGTNVDNVYPAS